MHQEQILLIVYCLRKNGRLKCFKQLTQNLWWFKSKMKSKRFVFVSQFDTVSPHASLNGSVEKNPPFICTVKRFECCRKALYKSYKL